jgi:hypothetical protein
MLKSKQLTIPFYGNLLNSAHRLFSNSHNHCYVTKNVHMSRRWKGEQVAYGIYKQLSPRFTLLMP